MMTDTQLEALRCNARLAVQRVEEELTDLRMQLARAERRADLAEKSATDAWQFARLMAKTRNVALKTRARSDA